MPEKSLIDIEIERVHNYVAKLEPKSPEYQRATASLETLYRTRDQHNRPAALKVPPEYVTAGAGLLGTLLVLNYERLEVITSKAFQWIKFR